MPIKGLSNREESFAQIGQIRKGKLVPVEGKAGKTRPIDLKFFRVVFDEEEHEARVAFYQVYPDEPTEVNVLLPFNDVDKVFDVWLEAYVASRMVARSDGERFLYLVDLESGEVVVKDGNPIKYLTPAQAEGSEPIAHYKNQRGEPEPVYLKPEARLKVVIPELGRLAYLMVITHSVHDIANLDKQLRGYKATNRGQLAGIPFVLRRRKKEITKKLPGGKRMRGPSWLLSIEPNPKWVQAKLLEMQAGAAPMLPEGDFAGYLPPLLNGGERAIVNFEPQPVLEGEVGKLEIVEPQPDPAKVEHPSALKWDTQEPPKSPKDYKRYYEAATQYLGRDEAREVLAGLQNDALKAFAHVGKMVASMGEPEAVEAELVEEELVADMDFDDYVVDPDTGEVIPTNGK